MKEKIIKSINESDSIIYASDNGSVALKGNIVSILSLISSICYSIQKNFKNEVDEETLLYAVKLGFRNDLEDESLRANLKDALKSLLEL